MEGDEYTTSILFTILAESVDRDDGGDCFFDTTEKGDGAEGGVVAVRASGSEMDSAF